MYVRFHNLHKIVQERFRMFECLRWFGRQGGRIGWRQYYNITLPKMEPFSANCAA